MGCGHFRVLGNWKEGFRCDDCGSDVGIGYQCPNCERTFSCFIEEPVPDSCPRCGLVKDKSVPWAAIYGLPFHPPVQS
jgi:hypothetical protein